MVVGIRPSSIRLGTSGIPARVDLIENLGDALLVDLRLDDNIIRARVGTDMPCREGDTAFFSADPSHLHLFAADTRGASTRCNCDQPANILYQGKTMNGGKRQSRTS